MKTQLTPSIIMLSLLFACHSLLFSQESVSLAGKWLVALDPDSIGHEQKWFDKKQGDPISLPGTLDEAGYGLPTQGDNYGILSRRHKYIGAAWYVREFEIPRTWKGQDVELYLERVMWQSQAWVDGKSCGTQDGLGTPHNHQLGKLSPGKHQLVVRIDNSMIYNIGDKGHSYGEYTQIEWNGMIGKIELQARPTVSFDRLNLYPDAPNKQLSVKFNLQNRTKSTKAKIVYRLKDLSNGQIVQQTEETLTCKSPEQIHEKSLQLPESIKEWSDIHPNLYSLEVAIISGKESYRKEVEFGFRNVTTERSKILINGRPVFMRGNLDCLHFPLTGYPSCDVTEWERIFRIYKDYGLNHVRFHSWCPPEAAFIAANRIGIYIQAEVLWIDWWMSVINPERPEMTTQGLPKGLGHNPSADRFVPEELKRMIEAYGNHPSFVMLCIGNELGNSDFDVMQQWIKPMMVDKRRLYSVSTARKITPIDQYMATHYIPEAGGTYGITGTGTDADREAVYTKSTLPIIAHELGQYPVYPLWSEIQKYTGVLEARNLEVYKELAFRKGVGHQDRMFHDASGALQSLLYKAMIENLLRTSSCAGFQMLSMTDYSGQGEALIGWLDSFWESKGGTTPDEFRRHSNDVVPLARFEKYVWDNKETFSAEIEVANYGDQEINSPIEWTFASESGQLIKKGTISAKLPYGKLCKAGSLSVDLSPIKEPGKYFLDVTIAGTPYHNRWSLWIYPTITPQKETILIKETFDKEAKEALERGEKVLLFAHELGKEHATTPLFFEPLFWSNSFFPGQSNKTLGSWIDKAHPALQCFPTDSYTDWQWKSFTKGKSFIINDYPNLTPIVQPISDFHINDRLASIFECKIGKGRLMVCGYNLNNESPAARQLKYSLLRYMQQTNFNPTATMQEEELQRMFEFTPKAVTDAPKGFEDASLYIVSGGALTTFGSHKWSPEVDKVIAKEPKWAYKVEANDIWRDNIGVAWTGKEMTVEIETPNGVIGDLYVHFDDWNDQRRTGVASIEGRECLIEKIGEKGIWIKLFVMREDTNDGKITLKVRTTEGGNMMISSIAFKKH